DTANGFDVYSYTFPETYTKVIFNNGASSQTTDQTVSNGKYYDVATKAWYASLSEIPVPEVDLSTNVYLVGSFNSWNTAANEFTKASEGATTATVTLELAANTAYTYKVVNNGAWTSCSTAVTGDVSGLKFSNSVSGDAKITTKDAGEYVFTFDLSANTLAVTYPVVEPECEHTSHGQDGKCTECGEPVEHAAGAAATCCTAQTCTVCGKELAPATGEHTYEDGCTATRPDDGINTLDELIAALAGDATEIVITETIVIPEGKEVTLNLNGKTVNSVFNGTSTTNHIYALRNYGTLVIEGEGSINSRGIYNHGSRTLNGGTNAAIDAKGGYAVNNEEGSTFIMNGGTVSADNEDGDAAEAGKYDATAIDVPDNCTATLNGGKITNAGNFTLAINVAGGTLNVPADSTVNASGAHGVISVSGGTANIAGGTFTCIGSTTNGVCIRCFSCPWQPHSPLRLRPTARR
ncbi:MAG: hypothetical protein IIW85_07715, partial [Bacteroidaceae bacterium]|nr:hypothetical protein [Bacteroidaceae bacterium]